jgi:hypothetical protein
MDAAAEALVEEVEEQVEEAYTVCTSLAAGPNE